MINRTVNKLIS